MVVFILFLLLLLLPKIGEGIVKWHLLRCLSKDCLTSANEIALCFTFKNSISQKKQTTNNELIDKLFENLLEKIKHISIQIKDELASIQKLDGLKQDISFQRMNDKIKSICQNSGLLKYAKIADAVKSISDQSLPAITITNITQAIQETKHSLIAQALAKVLSQQNVVLIFELEEYGQAIFSIKSLFWDKLVEYLPAEPDTYYNLLFLVKGHSNQLDNPISQSFQDFEKILPKPYFCWDNVRDWLSDPEVKTGLKLEDLKDQTAIDKKTEMIWEEAEKEGQPELLLKAIYQQFNKPWKEVETWWHSLKS